MPFGSKVFVPVRCLGYVSNHLPLQVRYITRRKENLIVTCVGRSFHTYGASHFSLLSVSNLHPSDITCMAADTYHIYTASDTTIYAWRRGTELKHVYKNHKKSVHSMLPFALHLIAVDEDSNVTVWDIKQETIFFQMSFSNESFKITTVMHPLTLTNKILFGSEQGSLELWNINTGKMIYTFKGWDSPVMCIEQTPAVGIVAIGLYSGRIILHDLREDKTILEFHQDHGPVTSIAFRTDGSDIMATGSVNGLIVFWNLNEKRVTSQLTAHDASVTGMVCLPNEPLIITSSPDNTLKMWIFDMTDGGARLLRIREGHSAAPNYIRFHGSNGHNILSAGGDSSLRIFNTQTEQFNKSLGKASYNRKASKKRKQTVQDPYRMNPIVQFTSETTREKEWDNIAAIHSDLLITTTWSYHKLKMGELKLKPNRINKEETLFATSIFITHCGHFVIVGYSDGYVDRYNIQSGLHRETYGTPKAHNGPVRGIASDCINQTVITGGSDLSVKFWKFKSQNTNPQTTLEVGESVNFFRIHDESSMLAVALENFTVLIIDIDARTVVRKFEGHTAKITDAAFSPDSRWLVTSSMDCSIRTWNIPSAKLIDQFKTDSPCISIDMSPTGELIATAHIDYLGIFLWCNRTLYAPVTLKAIDPTTEPPNVVLDAISIGETEVKYEFDDEDDEKDLVAKEQLDRNLITLSGLPTSRWLNLLYIDSIKKRNKPKDPPKVPKSAPFFLPTLPSLQPKFDLSGVERRKDNSNFIMPLDFTNLTVFGKQLSEITDGDFSSVLEVLKTKGPTAIDQEIKGFGPHAGGSIDIMIQFFKLLKFMFESNQYFELAQSYLSAFLKAHTQTIASDKRLIECLKDIDNLSLEWERLKQEIDLSIAIASNICN